MTAAVVAVAFLVAFVLSSEGRTAMGAPPSGERLEQIKNSPQWSGGHFNDVLPRQASPFVESMKAFLFGGSDHRLPSQPLPVERRTRADFDAPPESGLRITWLGHSTLIIELDGKRILIDPVWGPYAAPFSWMGVGRFYDPPLPFEELPTIDVVVISHDHYDHLDYPTMLALAKSDVPFLVPLGVGSHLEHWGIARERITELDWWERRSIGDITLVATPARHFSGRALTDREETLWAGWAILGTERRVYYTGDTAMFPGLTEIGERLGPFDVTLIESGAYSPLWVDVHLGPEQAVQAHQMLRGKLMIPVHWGLFDLAIHGWTEPMERVLAAAQKLGVRVASPRPGESIEPSNPPPVERWWPALPWDTVDDAPVISTGLETR
jgi:L-ascorbate metabolism protein UlaG (beta-lactamase superfamily)